MYEYLHVIFVTLLLIFVIVIFIMSHLCLWFSTHMLKVFQSLMEMELGAHYVYTFLWSCFSCDFVDYLFLGFVLRHSNERCLVAHMFPFYGSPNAYLKMTLSFGWFFFNALSDMNIVGTWDWALVCWTINLCELSFFFYLLTRVLRVNHSTL